MKPDYKKILKLGLGGLGLLIAVFLLLNIFGKLFIEQISQDLFVQDKNAPTDIVATLSEPAPYFELQNLKGKLIKITDFRGGAVVVVFWNSWNEVSGSQIKVIDDISLKYLNLFKIITINSQENRASVTNFMNRGSYSKTEVLLDTNGGVGDVYESRNVPAFYFIDKNGLLVDKYFGFLTETEIVEKMSKFSN
jgi:hypothetical protein